jgi:hypothetical protein
MGQEIGQSSRHQPAVVWDGSLFHMAFSANDDTNRILYATSPDGLSWTLGADTGQTSSAAPALTVSQPINPRFNWHLLVLVFVANDPSNRILFSVLDLTENPVTRGWRYVGQVGGESAQAVSALGGSFFDVKCYFTANDSSNRLLLHSFVPYPGLPQG